MAILPENRVLPGGNARASSEEMWGMEDAIEGGKWYPQLKWEQKTPNIYTTHTTNPSPLENFWARKKKINKTNNSWTGKFTAKLGLNEHCYFNRVLGNTGRQCAFSPFRGEAGIDTTWALALDSPDSFLPSSSHQRNSPPPSPVLICREP